MKKVFLCSVALSFLSSFAMAWGKKSSSNHNNCANQPGTTWNGSTCVYNGYGATSAQCGYQPEYTWNGQTCIYIGGGAYGATSPQCGNQPGYMWNGQTCVYSGGGYNNGYNTGYNPYGAYGAGAYPGYGYIRY
jgi:hypothetical protein